MAKKIILHLAGEDPILCELNALPTVTDQFITVRNPRKRDGKPLHYLTDGATSFIFPLQRITFIEVMDEEEQKDEGGVVAFFREDSLPRRR